MFMVSGRAFTHPQGDQEPAALHQMISVATAILHHIAVHGEYGEAARRSTAQEQP
jgi:hypothetical protein